MGLHALRHTPWFIVAACATAGDGLDEGLDWLSAALDGKATPAAGKTTSASVGVRAAHAAHAAQDGAGKLGPVPSATTA